MYLCVCYETVQGPETQDTPHLFLLSADASTPLKQTLTGLRLRNRDAHTRTCTLVFNALVYSNCLRLGFGRTFVDIDVMCTEVRRYVLLK